MQEKKRPSLPTPRKLKAIQAARTEKARAEQAQAGQGAPNVLAFKSYREIPKCMIPLFTDEGKKAYDDVVRAKYDAGKLTLNMLNVISSYAHQIDNITRAALTGKPPRGSWSAQLDRAIQKLDLDNERTIIAAPEEAPINRFSNTGFSARGRQVFKASQRRR